MLKLIVKESRIQPPCAPRKAILAQNPGNRNKIIIKADFGPTTILGKKPTIFGVLHFYDSGTTFFLTPVLFAEPTTVAAIPGVL